MGNLLQELKRRKVFRVAAVYAIVAWLIIKITGEILPTFNAPQWVNQAIVPVFILGLLVDTVNEARSIGDYLTIGVPPWI